MYIILLLIQLNIQKYLLRDFFKKTWPIPS